MGHFIFDIVVLSGIKHWQISQVFAAVYLSQLSQTSILNMETRRGAMLESSSNRLAVSFIEAANDRRQHSGLSSLTFIPHVVCFRIHKMNVSPLSVHHKFKCLVIGEVLVDGLVGSGDPVKQFFIHQSQYR